jgi:hypothetical protein
VGGLCAGGGAAGLLTGRVVESGIVLMGGDGAGAEAPPPICQVCSGVKLGGEHGVFERNPSALKDKHWLPAPTPPFTALLTSGNPMPPARLAVELKKYCWSNEVSPSPTARPPMDVVSLYQVSHHNIYRRRRGQAEYGH